MSRLFYRQSAGNDWNKALPIGNGRLGGMIFGDPFCERIQVNEDSVWYGGPLSRVNKDAKESLNTVRELILSGSIKEAEELMLHAFTGTPESERTYATLGNIDIRYPGISGEITGYERELDLDDAVFRLKKKAGGITYREEIHANAPENVIAIRIYTEEGACFDADAHFSRMTFYDSSFHDTDTVYALGSMVGENYYFAAGLCAVHDGGVLTVNGEYLTAKGVKELLFLFSASTTFYVTDPLSEVKSRLTSAKSRTYETLFSEHLRDYHEYYDRVSLKLSFDEECEDIPTDERRKLYQPDCGDNGFVKTYFDFSRYLFISCSRPGSQPANLQGIWNDSMNPPWGSKYTININAEMNYWAAESLGLSECHMPLFDLMKRMHGNGLKTADEMYGCRGTVAHHNTDIWGDTAPQDAWIPATYWVMGMAWLCTHIAEHYRYTGDTAFLKDMYPVIKDSVLFFHDFLIEKEDGIILCPSLSPENVYILPSGQSGHACYNSLMDMQILRDLFTDYLKAAEILGDTDRYFIEKTERLLSKIPPIGIGKHGQIMEWPEDYEEAEPGHRHISQLYALFPSSQIPTDDPENALFKAARATLERRLHYGGGHTGWSRAWIMNLYARLRDGEKVYENLTALLKRSTLDNLFDNHPPFQIDGNFGALSAIVSMFLQCFDNRVYLLPALPKAFANGSFTGIRAYHGGIFDLRFQNGALTDFSVKAERGDYEAEVIYDGVTFSVKLSEGEEKLIRII